MGKASLYVVYSWQGDAGHGLGQTTVNTDVIYHPNMRDLRHSEINTIRDQVLEATRRDVPSIKTLFLTFWAWMPPELTT